jgi:Restriction endonuclease
MSITKKFSWNRLTDLQFEELVYAILASGAPERITWRIGPGDQGRDIEVSFSRPGALGETIRETYFVEAKHYQSGVPPTALAGALAWAQAEQPDVLLIAVSSHLTTPCRQHIDAWGRNNPRVRILIWERSELENEILASHRPATRPSLRAYCRLRSPSCSRRTQAT